MDIPALQPVVDNAEFSAYFADYGNGPNPTLSFTYTYDRDQASQGTSAEKDISRAFFHMIDALQQSLVDIGKTVTNPPEQTYTRGTGIRINIPFQTPETRKKDHLIAILDMNEAVRGTNPKVFLHFETQEQTVTLSDLFANAGPQMAALGEKLHLAEIEQAHSHRGGPGIG